MPGIPSKDASFVWGTPRNYALTVHNPINMILLRYFEPASRVVRLGVGVLVTFLISWGIVFVGSKIKGVSRILFFIKG